MSQLNLIHQISQKYCIDTCAILDFWDSGNKTRPYHVKVKSFRSLWEHISKQVETSTIIVPEVVSKEITTENQELNVWLNDHKGFFVKHDDCLNELSKIVSLYPVYTTKKGSLHDAIVIVTAMHRNITVITSEIYSREPNKVRPKIPNVCDDFSVKWMNLPEYFEAEGL